MATSWMPMPDGLKKLYSHFPLYYTPANPPPASRVSSSSPVLWITPPLPTSGNLSKDVECLKWQAYIALRGLKDVSVRWDIHPSGGIDGRLPCLWIPLLDSEGRELSRGEVLGARMIPGWADGIQEEHIWNGELEGYIDENAKDESRAWVALLEGAVHAALVGTVSFSSFYFLFCSLFLCPRKVNISTVAIPAFDMVIFPSSTVIANGYHAASPSSTPDGFQFDSIPTRAQYPSV